MGWEPGTIKKTGHLVKEGFTLVELLIVLLLMGMVYAIAFNTVLQKTASGESEPGRVTYAAVDEIFRQNDLFGRADLVLYGTNEKKGYLVSEGKVLRTVDLPRNAVAYRLNPDETLQSAEYAHLKFGTVEITPTFHIHCRKEGLFDPQILAVEDRWLYIHPYRRPRFFDAAAALVSHIRQSDYLPDKAGYAQ